MRTHEFFSGFPAQQPPREQQSLVLKLRALEGNIREYVYIALVVIFITLHCHTRFVCLHAIWLTWLTRPVTWQSWLSV